MTETGGGARDNEQYAVDTGPAPRVTPTAMRRGEHGAAPWAACGAAP